MSIVITAPQYVDGALTAKSVGHQSVNIYPPGTPPPGGVWSTVHTPSGQLVVVGGLSPQDQTKANSIIQALNPLADMTPRSRWEIMQGVMTLTADQLSRAWQDLANGYPDRLQLDQSLDAVVL